jgi:hypothetical protein
MIDQLQEGTLMKRSFTGLFLSFVAALPVLAQNDTSQDLHLAPPSAYGAPIAPKNAKPQAKDTPATQYKFEGAVSARPSLTVKPAVVQKPQETARTRPATTPSAANPYPAPEEMIFHAPSGPLRSMSAAEIEASRAEALRAGESPAFPINPSPNPQPAAAVMQQQQSDPYVTAGMFLIGMFGAALVSDVEGDVTGGDRSDSEPTCRLEAVNGDGTAVEICHQQ